ncbi:ribosomal L7Ae/L30e/S12e/Gadd45 family protein [Clostridiaceae bacterium NSJ-31]|uniref:Ribosomal L7Ae/L30e/S12e/Gadd45 family protein n=1 Tax=Ligaoa zhengdingensis TaxID=2763658 RepID=A0A926DV25_9FIRM|nr:ribosomal L7Ae/L30e/S12e/Gadd45 family protein [Ligaoa zhengdingensis]
MNRLLSTISLCKRAGKLLMGYDRVKDAVFAGKAHIVFTATDLSERSRKGVILLCEADNIDHFVLPFSMEQLEYEIGRRTGILAVTDPGLAGKLHAMLTASTEE